MIEKECYAARMLDRDALFRSSSGGVFGSFAVKVIEHGGCVFGCAWDSGMRATHVKVERIEDLPRLRGSKYVRSDVTRAYADVINELCSGRFVLFSGTPCEVAALLKIAQNEKTPLEKLFTVELICHGAPDPKVWNAYLSQLKKRVVNASFKDKTTGWNDPTLRFDFDDGTCNMCCLYSDAYVRAFESGLSLGKGCFACPFKSGRSGADLTIGDFWGGEEYIKEWDDDLGISCVVLNTVKGKMFWEGDDFNLLRRQIQYGWIRRRNPNIEEPPTMPDGWMKFRLEYQKRKMSVLVKRILEGPAVLRIARRVRGRICRMVKGLAT